MSTSPDASNREVVPNEWPLRFHKHNFSAYCYNTVGCKVLYNGFYHQNNDEDEVSPPPEVADYRKYWGGAPYAGIQNFPPPVVVTWRSRDGAAHEAKIDIGEIFKNQVILHNVPREELPVDTIAATESPNIYIEVDDRTINVYMQAMVYLKDTATRHSEFRYDLMLAYSRTY